MIVAILNQKGGSGKMTIATNLACGLKARGEEVLLADSDPQGSAREGWYAAGEGERLTVISMDSPPLFRGLPKLAQRFIWVIIDGSPKLENLAIAALKVADTIIISVQPFPYDVWAIDTLAQLVKARQQLMEAKPKAWFLISHQIVGTRLAKELREALEAHELPMMTAYTSQRVIYASCANEGKSVLGYEAERLARHEIEVLTEEVRGWQ